MAKKKTAAPKAAKAPKAQKPVKMEGKNCDTPHKVHESGRYDLPQTA